MSDEERDTIDHLRAILKDTQSKLDTRTEMLAHLLPNVEAWALDEANDAHYTSLVFCERFEKLIKQFKDDYGREGIQTAPRISTAQGAQ